MILEVLNFPPLPRPDILPLCCHRLILRGPTHPEANAAWQELPDRHMDWAPVRSNTWLREWVCLRCNT